VRITTNPRTLPAIAGLAPLPDIFISAFPPD
jgi:hypothetical protein